MAGGIYTRAAWVSNGGVTVAGGAEIEVREQETGGQPLASIFSDRALTTPKSNPFNADSDGYFEFFAAGLSGGYRVRVKQNATIRTLTHQSIGTAQEHDTDFFANADGSIPITGPQTYEDYIELSETSTPSSPTDAVRIHAFDQNGETRLKYVDPDGVQTDVSQDNNFVVRNQTGATLSKGQVVYVENQTGVVPDVALARSDSVSTMPAIAVLQEGIADAAFGVAVKIGVVGDIDTSSFSVNDTLYVSESTPGGFTNTRPPHPHLNQAVARVLVSGVGNGQVKVNIDSKDGDSLGTRENAFKIGDGSAGTKSLTFDGSADASIQWDGTDLSKDGDNFLFVSDTNIYTDADKTKVDFISVSQAVDLDQIESRVNDLDAAVVLRGSWDASTGTFPGGGSAQAGDSYIISTGGTVDSIEFTVNDRIVAITDNASTTTYANNWLKLDYTDRVNTVFGRTGNVTAQSGDYSFSQISGSASTSQITEISNLTAAEGAQLENMDSVTVSNTQWGYLGGLASAPLEDNDLAANGGTVPQNNVAESISVNWDFRSIKIEGSSAFLDFSETDTTDDNFRMSLSGGNLITYETDDSDTQTGLHHLHAHGGGSRWGNPTGGTPSTAGHINAEGLLVNNENVSVNSTTATHTAQQIELGDASDTTLSRNSAGDVAVEGNLMYRAGGTDVPIADGGTGASTASGARSNLGIFTGSVTFSSVPAGGFPTQAVIQHNLGTDNLAMIVEAVGNSGTLEEREVIGAVMTSDARSKQSLGSQISSPVQFVGFGPPTNNNNVRVSCYNGHTSAQDITVYITLIVRD